MPIRPLLRSAGSKAFEKSSTTNLGTVERLSDSRRTKPEVAADTPRNPKGIAEAASRAAERLPNDLRESFIVEPKCPKDSFSDLPATLLQQEDSFARILRRAASQCKRLNSWSN